MQYRITVIIIRGESSPLKSIVIPFFNPAILRSNSGDSISAWTLVSPPEIPPALSGTETSKVQFASDILMQYK
jgi:hypothetical protein